MRRVAHFLLLLLVAVFLPSCGGGGAPVISVPGPTPPVLLSAADVSAVVNNAAASANVPFVIAVTDRVGNVLAVFRKTGAPATATGNFGSSVSAGDLAVALARTAAFFSNSQAPLSSRTVRFISGVHFPPGVSNTPSAALYGIENTNRGCPLNASFAAGQSVPPARALGGGLGLGIITGKADSNDSDPNAVNPGGVPLFKSGVLVGGVGVAGAAPDVAEFAAFTGAAGAGFGASPAPPGVVVIDGIALPFVTQTTRPAGITAGSTAGAYLVSPIAAPAAPPEGDLVVPMAGSRLSQSEVAQTISAAVTTAEQTRAVIRLPDGSRTRMVIAVADLDGTILALHRMPDSSVFSIDVAVAKARNVIWFSSAGSADLPGVPANTAVTNRTIGFGAQPMFPPGIDGSGLGPFFSLYLSDLATPCRQGSQALSANQNGIVFFPGSAPLYRNGVLVGGLGVSGDGVDQDDFVTAGGAQNFLAPDAIRADQVSIQNVRLPYWKFPRNPTN
jgi:uncharacterized protein GlcG (DUF336 family)